MEYYDCGDLLPFISRIFWLNSVREVLGHLPDWINPTYEEVQALVILHDEMNKKQKKDALKMREDSKRQQRSMPKSTTPRHR